MTDLQPLSRQALIEHLNSTPQNSNLLRLMRQAKVPHAWNNLATTTVLLWAMENLQLTPAWAQAVERAVLVADADDPAQATENLAEAGAESAQTLEQAAMLLLKVVADLVPPMQAA